MREHFEQLADAVCREVDGCDRTSLSLAAESSDFIRFNHAQVRQATHVAQQQATVSVLAGQRRSSGTLSLTGDLARDTAALLAERAELLAQLPLVPEDKHLLVPQAIESTEHDKAGALPSAAELIDAVTTRAAGTDFVGFHAAGPVVRAYADSRGQRNWHRVDSFMLDWSLYREGDQAVKSTLAGTDWDLAAFEGKMQRARERAALLAFPRKTVPPGEYRACFSPVATAGLLGLLGWGGFSEKAARTGVSPLVRLQRGEARFHPTLQVWEDTEGGIAPRFQADGFVKPPRVPLIADGRAAGLLCAPRTAREYGLTPNGSLPGEAPESLSVAPGTLDDATLLRTLGTGVYVSNVHYLNFSDRRACRATGLTRFASFWVEGGELVAPLSVMRFDDSLLRMFGDGLVGLAAHAELVPSSLTYQSRHLASVTAPAAIVEGFRFTL